MSMNTGNCVNEVALNNNENNNEIYAKDKTISLADLYRFYVSTFSNKRSEQRSTRHQE